MSAVTACHKLGQAMDANAGVYQNKLTKQIAKNPRAFRGSGDVQSRLHSHKSEGTNPQ